MFAVYELRRLLSGRHVRTSALAKEFVMCELLGMADEPSTAVAALRKRLGLTLEAFAAAVELKSKGQASEIEKSDRCSPEVALRIERLSGGTVDAGALSPVIAAARQGIAA